MTRAEWVNLVANVVAAIATVAGFTLAVWQLVRAARAAETAARAAEQNRLLGLAQAMRGVERDLDVAADNAEREAAFRALRDWRELVPETRGLLLAQQPAADADLLKKLELSVQIATETKAES